MHPVARLCRKEIVLPEQTTNLCRQIFLMSLVVRPRMTLDLLALVRLPLLAYNGAAKAMLQLGCLSFYPHMYGVADC
jgi:hypothetical protein